MSDAATLTAGLLARKGGAAPVTFMPKLVPTAGVTATAMTRRRRSPRVSVRMEDGRLLKLRLIAAHLGVTRQELMTRAFDEFLLRHMPTSDGGCHCLVGGDCKGAENDRACDRAR